MPKRPTRKERVARQTHPGALTPDDLATGPERRRTIRSLAVAVALLGVLLYVNTLGHQYALDDGGLIAANSITKRGWDGVLVTFRTSYWAGLPGVGDSLYRPLSKAMFAAEWGLAPHRPALSHAVNVLLYGLTGFLLVLMLTQYLRGHTLVPVAAAALFIAHPLHTEAVANIKGRDEILSFLFFLLTGLAMHRFATRRSRPALLLAATAFFLALLSKESAITFLAVLPLMLVLFTDAPRARILAALAALGGVTGLVLFIRQLVVGGGLGTPESLLENYLLAIPDLATRTATAIYLMGIYLKLLFVPYPLVSDGTYQHFPTVAVADWRFLLPALVYAALAVYACLRLRTKDLLSFSILYFFITASAGSNLLVLIGTNYGERLMYTPSLGFCLALAALLARGVTGEDSPATTPTLAAFARAYRGPLILVGLVVALYGVMTVTRNADWFDDDTRITRDVEKAPRSARLHYALGQTHLFDAEKLGKLGDAPGRQRALTKAVAELDRALEIYPQYARALHSLALAHHSLGATATARGYFEKSLQLAPSYSVAHNDFANLLLALGDEKGALEHYQIAVRYQPDYGDAHLNLGLALARAGEQSIRTAAEEQKRHNEPVYRDHMMAATRSFQAALAHLKRATDIAPDDHEAYDSMAAIYQFMGDERNARALRDRAEEIKRRKSRRG